MEEYKLIQTESPESQIHLLSENITLHEDILEIFFKHKEEVHRQLIDLRGTFLIDHIAIKIIDPSNKMVIFSITPSVEYNLVVQGLWRYDKSFCVNFQKNNNFYTWEKAYSREHFHELKQIKEAKHGFTFGFNISKKIGDFNFIYSYATRHKAADLYEYYYTRINELSGLGDYGYKLIHSIYAKYCSPNNKFPIVTKKYDYPSRPLLRLVVNNKK